MQHEVINETGRRGPEVSQLRVILQLMLKQYERRVVGLLDEREEWGTRLRWMESWGC